MKFDFLIYVFVSPTQPQLLPELSATHPGGVTEIACLGKPDGTGVWGGGAKKATPKKRPKQLRKKKI
jgi:hypothetical protein